MMEYLSEPRTEPTEPLPIQITVRGKQFEMISLDKRYVDEQCRKCDLHRRKLCVWGNNVRTFCSVIMEHRTNAIIFKRIRK